MATNSRNAAGVRVILPEPGRSGVEPNSARLMMTTCHPRFSARQWPIVDAVLTDIRSKADGEPAVTQPKVGG
jgi:sortase A